MPWSAGADHDADPADFAVDGMTLAGYPGAELDLQGMDSFDDVLGTTDGARRPVEGREEPSPRCRSRCRDSGPGSPNDRMVPFDDATPGPIP